MLLPKGQIVRKRQHSEMKFDRSSKYDLCYYGEDNSLRVKSSVASKSKLKTLGGGGGGYHLFIYFAGDGSSITLLVFSVL